MLRCLPGRLGPDRGRRPDRNDAVLKRVLPSGNDDGRAPRQQAGHPHPPHQAQASGYAAGLPQLGGHTAIDDVQGLARAEVDEEARLLALSDEGPDGPGYLSIHQVQKAYKKRKVVRNVSLSVRRGESVGLLGPNGAGKTTCFYMITGLVPADGGLITLDGVDVTHLPMYQRAKLGIGYLPQEASIFRGLTVEQNIMAVLELVEPNRKKRKQQLDDLLDEFNIGRLRKSPSIALSGGEGRPCGPARARASRPSCMLLDEPFAGIDPIAVGDIQHLVRQLTDRGIGVLITDHNVRETLALIDRAYIIYDGHVLTHGNPETIIANEDVRRVYLGDMFINER